MIAHHLEHVAHGAGLMVVGGGVQHPTVAADVVHHDDGTRRTQLHRPLDVGDVVLLVGVDEDQVERFAAVGQGRQRVQRGADDHLDLVRDACALEVLPRHLRVLGCEFERDDLAAGPDAASQIDGAVAGKRADLKDPAGVRHHRQQRQQLAVLRRHLDGGHPRGDACLPRGAQRVVLGVQHRVEHLVKGFGVGSAHTSNVTASARPPWSTPP